MEPDATEPDVAESDAGSFVLFLLFFIWLSRLQPGEPRHRAKTRVEKIIGGRLEARGDVLERRVKRKKRRYDTWGRAEQNTNI